MVAIILSVLFGLPHILIPRLLGPDRPYTPFAVRDVSALTYDETTTYAPQLNYTWRRNSPAYDTDAFEEKDVPVPVPTLPYFALAAAASLLGGVAQTFIAGDFVLPPLAFLLLYLLIFDITHRHWLSMLGAVTCVLVPFGPRNFFEVPLQVALGRSATIIQPLEMSRLLQPQVSFPLFTAALLGLWRALRTRRAAAAVAAGALGGTLFYTYVYYWPAWVATIGLLLVAFVAIDRVSVRTLAIVNVVTWATSVPFWVIYFRARQFPNMAELIERHTSESGHLPSLEKLTYSAVYIGVLAVLSYVFVRVTRPQRKHNILLFHWAVLGGGLAGLNMEVLTGVNVEALMHFSNRLFQPFFVIAAATLGGPALLASRLGTPRLLRAVCGVSLVGLLLIAGVRQVLVSRNVAPYHEYPEEQRLLFSWLEANTQTDDVVMTTDTVINYIVPLYTRDRVYVPDAERSGVAYRQIERRYLIAMKLMRHSEQDLRDELGRDAFHGDPPLGLTTSYYLFGDAGGTRRRGLVEARLAEALRDYRALDLESELRRWRVDYAYARAGEVPAQVRGWTIREVYETRFGSVWRVQPAAATAQDQDDDNPGEA